MSPADSTRLSPWFFCPKKNPSASLRLICFPYAGGSAAVYASWLRHLPGDIEMLSIQYPGRATRFREAPITDLDTIVKECAQAIAAQSDKPLVLFGHSMGARIAYEVTLYLKKQYEIIPQLLIASASAPPHKGSDANSVYVQREKARGGVPMYKLNDADFCAELRFLQGTPDALLADDEMMALVLPSLRADFELVQHYTQPKSREKVACPLVTFCSDGDVVVGKDAIGAWRELTEVEYRQFDFSGNHFFIHTLERQVIAVMNAEIERCVRAGLAFPSW